MVDEKTGAREMFLQIPDFGRPVERMTLTSRLHCFSVKAVANRLYSSVFQMVVVMAVKLSSLFRWLFLILSAHVVHLSRRCWKCEVICPDGENFYTKG